MRHPGGGWSARVLRAAAARYLRALGRSDAELSIVVETDRGIRALNAEHRKKDKPTDVLSFPQDEPDNLGDVVISLDTARRQAAERSHPLSVELRRLLAHGVLHLLGHDHHDEREAARMAAAEDALLGRAGMVREARFGDTLPRGKASRTARKRR